tara:strand:- start:190 stop:471 length:282 start_codon:yes stop_codon:yes gene_type:complete
MRKTILLAAGLAICSLGFAQNAEMDQSQTKKACCAKDKPACCSKSNKKSCSDKANASTDSKKDAPDSTARHAVKTVELKRVEKTATVKIASGS